MPLQTADLPADAYSLLQRAVRKVSTMRGPTAAAIAAPDPSTLGVAVPHQVYLIDARDALDNVQLSAARLVAWRCLLISETDPLAVVELHCDSDGGNLRYANTTVGPFVASIRRTVSAAESLGEVVAGSYELRALVMPSVYLQALWLKDLKGTNDIIITFTPTKPGTFQVRRSASLLAASGGGALTSGGAQHSIGSLFAEAQQTLSTKRAFDNSPRLTTSSGALGGSAQPKRSDVMPNQSGMPTSDVTAGASTASPHGGGISAPLPPTSPKIYPSVPRPGGGQGPAGGGGGTTTGGSGANPFIVNRQDLIKNYANMVAKTWTDPSFLQLLLSNPVQTLDQAGIPTIPGAVIRVLQIKLTGIGRIEEVVDKWVDGIRTGQYDLYIPIKPDGISIGASGGGDINCCCTPCCCCT